MNAWQLTSRPQRLTELYFTNYQHLPTTLRSGGRQTVSFAVHNLEYRTTVYSYKLIAAQDNDGHEYALGDGTLTLTHDSVRVVARVVTVPASDQRLAIRVSLQYEGIAFGASSPSLQSQSIHYWASVTDGKGKHETS